MRTLLGVKQLEKPLVRSVLTIGNFDGLHLGHRKIISRVVDIAHIESATSVVMTFDPHPRQVLMPDQSFKRLFSGEDLQKQLVALNVEYLVLEPFSRELSQMEADVFICEKIIKPFNPIKMVVGYDFTFGAKRKGTLSVLGDILKQANVGLEIIQPLKYDDEIISSTGIRQAVIEGDVTLATEMLGRFFYVEGVVEKGAGRGKTIGFPTANINIKSPLLPKMGVYSGWFSVEDTRYKAIINIGINPTFHEKGSPLKCEAHVLDYSRNLYDKTVRFEFCSRIRDEKKFENIASLVEQIKKDILITEQILANYE